MLLVLAEHPCDGEHHTLLADGVFVPTFVALLLAHIVGTETERTEQVLHIEVENQAFFHVHLTDTERSEIGTSGLVITGEHRRRPVGIKRHGPIFGQVCRERAADIAVMAFHQILGCAILLFVVRLVDEMQPAGIDRESEPCTN